MLRTGWWGGWLLLLLVACMPTAPSTPAPTRILIPAAATLTPTPTQPAPTPPPLAAPDDLGGGATPTAVLTIPAGAQPLLDAVVDDLARRLDIETGAVQLLAFETATWAAIDLGCGDDPMGASDRRVGGYRIVLLVEGVPYEYHTDETSRIRLCPTGSIAAANDLLLTDPIAAELVGLAGRQLAALLDISARRVELVEIVPYTWADTSLGCPLPEQTYSERQIDGYRILMRAGTDEYIFHADFDSVVLCDPANEQLPE